MDDCPKPKTHRNGTLPLLVSGLALLATMGVSYFAPKAPPPVASITQPPNYVLLNSEGGITYEQRGEAAVTANLYLDTNTLSDNPNALPHTKLELIARLNVSDGKMFLARKFGMRDCPHLTAKDLATDFENMSWNYEGPDYPSSHTTNLTSMIREASQPVYLPGSRIIIKRDSGIIEITSYDQVGTTIPDSQMTFTEETHPGFIPSYDAWLSRRLVEPFAEIQDDEREGDETHMTYLRPDESNAVATIAN